MTYSAQKILNIVQNLVKKFLQDEVFKEKKDTCSLLFLPLFDSNIRTVIYKKR